MNSIKTQTAQTPSCFGMPIYGSAYGAARGTTAVVAQPVLRDRFVADASGVKGAFPGTSAWRPPNC